MQVEAGGSRPRGQRMCPCSCAGWGRECRDLFLREVSLAAPRRAEGLRVLMPVLLALATSAPQSAAPGRGRGSSHTADGAPLTHMHLRRVCVSRASGLRKLCPDTGAGGDSCVGPLRWQVTQHSVRGVRAKAGPTQVPLGHLQTVLTAAGLLPLGDPGCPHCCGGHRQWLHTWGHQGFFSLHF